MQKAGNEATGILLQVVPLFSITSYQNVYLITLSPNEAYKFFEWEKYRCHGEFGTPDLWGTDIPMEFGMGVPNSRGCQIPYDSGSGSADSSVVKLV